MKKSLFIFFLVFSSFSTGHYSRLGEPVKQIETIKDGAGRLYLFTLGSDGRIYYARQAVKNGPWSTTKIINNTEDVRGDTGLPPPSYLFKQFALGLAHDGALVIYAIDQKGNLKVCNQSNSNPELWGFWTGNPPGSFSSQVLAIKTDKQYQQVFAFSVNGTVGYNHLMVSNSGSPEERRYWDTWVNLYGLNLRQLDCAEIFYKKPGNSWYSYLPVLFALSNDGSVYKIEQGNSFRNWNNWSSLGGTDLKKINVTRNSDGRLVLFAIGGDNDAYERHQLSAGPNSEWSEWTTLNGSHNFKDISGTVSTAGRVTLFGLHTDGSVEHIWQTDPGGINWSAWSPLYGGQIQSIRAERNEDGRMAVFAIGGDGQVYYRWQAVPDGYWEEWDNLSTKFP